MDIFGEARALYRSGQFANALSRLEALRATRFDIDTSLLKAALCEATGDASSARLLVEQTLRARLLTDSQRATGEFILSRLVSADGDPDSELNHLERSQTLAERAGDSEQLCWTQLRILSLTADRIGPESCRAMVARLRKSVSCLGSPNLSAAVHLAVADIDGKHGLLAKCARHVALAESLLARYPNCWLEGWAAMTRMALAMVLSDIPAAVAHGETALRLSADSGSAAVRFSALANMGRLLHVTGDYERSLEYLNQALDASRPNGERHDAISESIARVYMDQGRLREGLKLLERVQISDRASLRSGRYVHRHSLLTKAELLTRLGDVTDAEDYFAESIALAQRSGDTILEDTAKLLLRKARTDAGLTTSGAAVTPPFLATPDLAILYEQTLTSGLIAAGRLGAAKVHFDRAVRTCRAVSNRLAERELHSAIAGKLLSVESCGGDSVNQTSSTLQSFASLLMHASRPELTATSLVSILQHANCVVSARAVARDADDREELLAAWGAVTAPADVRTFIVGVARGRNIELQLQPLPDIESHAAVNSAGFVITAGQELERARLEREERLTLWPIDELPAEDDDSVVTGKMREVMLYARKVAPTNVTVLITGESGTGKEVLARAVHRYSQRSKKPFVPFNCTAVPRELLESHLFGFKRGAFTGADRDNPGLIRAAKDGTLFLDEVGELGLDLQPKLLRFLESGEINPLGETVPFCVNVRIVAATNANLKKLVQEGRFREDLYYRLNVIPLELPPLRERREEIPPLAQHFALKWSHELGKGRIRVADDLMEHLVVYPWPGNIRQLSNELNRMVATAETDATLTLDHLPKAMREETEQLRRRERGLELNVPLTDSLDHAVATLEREMIKLALSQNDGKVEAAAKALGISRKGLYLKRQRLGL